MNECRLWRLSFSAAEKYVMHQANTSKLKSCRKDVLRLLKQDLYTAKLTTEDKEGFCSFYLKNIVLSLTETTKAWDSIDLAERYIDALRKTVECLRAERVSSYFVLGANIIELKEISSKHKCAILKYYEEQIKKYTSLLERKH
jgi:hypothetical protein